MLKKIDHIGIYVANLDETLEKYETMFGARPESVETIEEFDIRIAMIPVGETMVELVAPVVLGRGPMTDTLSKQGEGLDHIAYRVDDIDAALDNLKRAGTKLVDEKPRPGAGGSRIAYINSVETNNVLVELVERKGDH